MSLEQKLKTGGTQYKCWCRLNMLRSELFFLLWISCSLLQSFEQKVSYILRILWRMNLSENFTFSLSNELALNTTSTSCSLYFASVPVVYFLSDVCIFSVPLSAIHIRVFRSTFLSATRVRENGTQRLFSFQGCNKIILCAHSLLNIWKQGLNDYQHGQLLDLVFSFFLIISIVFCRQIIPR